MLDQEPIFFDPQLDLNLGCRGLASATWCSKEAARSFPMTITRNNPRSHPASNEKISKSEMDGRVRKGVAAAARCGKRGQDKAERPGGPQLPAGQQAAALHRPVTVAVAGARR